MNKFLNDDFLLTNETGKKLFHGCAKKMPIYDFHCHLNPKEIYENKPYNNITEAWIYNQGFGDHYKWRLMRIHGIDEKYITGDAEPFDKFLSWCKAIESSIGNPLYSWSHMELQRYFHIDKVLSVENAKEIYDEANKLIPMLTPRALIKQSNVKYICTTDDPLDDLKYHTLLKEDSSFATVVRPTFRPDGAINIDVDSFASWASKLAELEKFDVNNFDEFLVGLKSRVDYFANHDCIVSDNSFESYTYANSTKDEASAIYQKKLNGCSLSKLEVDQYKTFILTYLGKLYHDYDWVCQLHIGAIRNTNTKCFEKIGKDSGFDAMAFGTYPQELAKLFDELEKEDSLPKIIVYPLSAALYESLITIINAFQKDVRGKIQLGSAWWFNDNKDGMEYQLSRSANAGLLDVFVGMLTDSRSFLSYPRHEYFRRILCNYIGSLVENGEFPNDEKLLFRIVEGICYNNAVEFFK